MSKFGVEEFFDQAITVLKAGFNSKIDEINEEKSAEGTELELEKIVDDSQYFEDFLSKVVSKEFFVVHRIQGLEPLASVGSKTATEVTLIFFVCYIDRQGGMRDIKKGLRYGRAITEIFKEKYDMDSRVSSIALKSYYPTSGQFDGSSQVYKIAGCELKGTINI